MEDNDNTAAMRKRKSRSKQPEEKKEARRIRLLEAFQNRILFEKEPILFEKEPILFSPQKKCKNTASAFKYEKQPVLEGGLGADLFPIFSQQEEKNRQKNPVLLEGFVKKIYNIYIYIYTLLGPPFPY